MFRKFKTLETFVKTLLICQDEGIMFYLISTPSSKSSKKLDMTNSPFQKSVHLYSFLFALSLNQKYEKC